MYNGYKSAINFSVFNFLLQRVTEYINNILMAREKYYIQFQTVIILLLKKAFTWFK